MTNNVVAGLVVDVNEYSYLVLKRVGGRCWECLNMNSGSIGVWPEHYLKDRGIIKDHLPEEEKIEMIVQIMQQIDVDNNRKKGK